MLNRIVCDIINIEVKYCFKLFLCTLYFLLLEITVHRKMCWVDSGKM